MRDAFIIPHKTGFVKKILGEKQKDRGACKKVVNSQSKFHSRKAVEFSMRNKRNLVWEKREGEGKEAKNKTKN